MIKSYTCVVCPNGCDIQVQIGGDGEILSLSGARCKRGKEYVRQELIAPMRTIASSVLVAGGEFPLVSVRLSAAIPRDRINDVMKEIKKCRVPAPVTVGQVIIRNVAGTDAHVIATKNVGRNT